MSVQEELRNLEQRLLALGERLHSLYQQSEQIRQENEEIEPREIFDHEAALAAAFERNLSRNVRRHQRSA